MNGDQTLNVVIKAKDQASATLDKFGSKVSSLGPTIAKMAAIGTAAFVAVGIAAFKMFEKYADAQQQTILTNTSLANSFKQLSGKELAGLTKAVEGSRSALSGLMEAAEKAGKAAVRMAFDDETAARSFSKLFAITKDVSKANSELAIAMDLARFKGITLEEATQKLVMVHAGATKELKALGIAIDETATVEENLQSIHKQTADSAEAFADSAKGAMERIGIQVDNLQEKIGEKLAPIFFALLDQASGLIDLLEKLSFDNIKESLSNFSKIVDEHTGLITLFKWAWDQIVITFNESLKPALIELWTALKPLEPALIMIAKVLGGALVLAIYGVVLAITGWIQVITNIIALAVEFATAVIKYFTAPIKDFIESVKSAIEWVGKLIDKMGAIGGKISGGVKSIGAKVGNLLGFEHGGTVPGAIGQAVPIIAHAGETIIPASRSGNVGGSGANITLNLNYPQFTNQDSVEVVRQQIEGALRDVVRIYKLQPA